MCVYVHELIYDLFRVLVISDFPCFVDSKTGMLLVLPFCRSGQNLLERDLGVRAIVQQIL